MASHVAIGLGFVALFSDVLIYTFRVTFSYKALIVRFSISKITCISAHIDKGVSL